MAGKKAWFPQCYFLKAITDFPRNTQKHFFSSSELEHLTSSINGWLMPWNYSKWLNLIKANPESHGIIRGRKMYLKKIRVFLGRKKWEWIMSRQSTESCDFGSPQIWENPCVCHGTRKQRETSWGTDQKLNSVVSLSLMYFLILFPRQHPCNPTWPLLAHGKTWESSQAHSCALLLGNLVVWQKHLGCQGP